MTTIFFFLCLAYFLYEITVLTNPRKSIEKLKKLSNAEFMKNPDIPASEKTSGCSFTLFAMSYLMWSFIGLAYSYQWLSFAILIVIGFVHMAIAKAYKKTILSTFIDALLSSLIILDIFVQHYHPELPGLIESLF
jgi:hypothetical protein